MAASSGLPFKEVSELGRRIREKGQFTRHTKKKESQVVTNDDLANLTIAVLSGLPPQHAHVAVTRMSASKLSRDDHKHVMQDADKITSQGGPLMQLLEPRHSFQSALAAIFGIARKGPSAFEEEYEFTFVRMDRRRFSGSIYLHSHIFKPLRETHLNFDVEYEPEQEFFAGDLQSESSLTEKTIAALARTTERVAL